LTATRAQVTTLVPAALLAFFLLPVQAAAPVIPGAGEILQQIQPVTPPEPSPGGTGLTTEPQESEKLPPSVPFLANAIRIMGNEKIDTAVLQALVADAAGKVLTLPQLDGYAARVTDYYHGHGYPLARAVIPVQVIRSGVVRMVIIEARYGKVGIDNRSRVNDSLLQATLAPLQSGQVIAQPAIDRSLLLLSDIPGVAVRATLSPGDATGISDLLVEAVPGPAVSGNVTLDNYGTRYTGKARIGGMVNIINPLHHGDVLSLNGLSSGRDLDYGQLSYESLLNGQGTRLGGSYSALYYMLGGPLTAIAAHGTAQVESLWLKHPLLRGPDANLYGQIQLDRKQLRDHIDTSAILTDRHLDNRTLSLAGDARDSFLSAAVDSWNLGWTSGHVVFDDGAAQALDASTARTQGGFSKWNASLVRRQSLGPQDGLYLTFTGQWASTNLDPAEKMIVGGPYTVRAYDMGALSGDSGLLGSLEFRHNLGYVWYGQWQAVAFFDTSHVTVNKSTWAAGPNSASLSGAGVELSWVGADQWTSSASIATPVGAVPAQAAGSAGTRAWLNIGKKF
jgi:hemolysin activation/secretion protein